ncbi:MAG: 2-amino-4-hydroxy-6-hydroxymethyldihydropteridine diphosphokinase, partial [Gammaproteobacteria bacterium]|nr:2-amino-4-hydroxy-6-hydroxymethyldihydropteridine diphosphokinase [Gammaproteobacteria bacterium]
MNLTKAYWCLGSNINPQQHIGFAVSRFQQDFSGVVASKLYRCPAVGFAGEDFLNMVLATETDRNLAELLEYGAQLEQLAGRVRVKRGRFDSRTLDVDLLMFGSLQGVHEGREWPSHD